MIPIDLVKKHLNIDPDFYDDDQYLLGLIEVAEQTVKVHVNEDLDVLAEKNGGCLPAPLFQAMLLQIGNLYQNREIIGTKSQALPYNYQYLIDLYKNYNR